MYKKDFPFFQNSELVYLDNAATTQKPHCVVQSQVDYYTKYCANTHRSSFSTSNKTTRAYEESRVSIQKFINASKKEEIIFTSGVTQGINFIASSFTKNFKNIIISSLEHHSNITPWHMQNRDLENGLKVVNCDENLNFDMNHYEILLRQNPNSFVSITHISNSFGKIHDIKTIVKLAHKYNCVVLIDAAQSLAHFKIDVNELDVDFLVMSGHKTFAPTGIGAVYIKEKYLDKLLAYETGGATIQSVDYNHSTLLSSPFKFEAGTQNIAGVIGFGQAIGYLESLDFDKIMQKEKELYLYLYKSLEKFDDIIFYTNPEDCTGSLSFNFKNISYDDIGILLDKQNIALRVGHHCTQPIMKKLGINGTVRASITFYNDFEDIDKLIIALEKALDILRD